VGLSERVLRIAPRYELVTDEAAVAALAQQQAMAGQLTS